MTRRLWVAACLLAVLAAPIASPPASAAVNPALRYRVIDISSLIPGGYLDPIPNGINDWGTVVGEVFTAPAGKGAPAPGLLRTAAVSAMGSKHSPAGSVPHVFVYDGGVMTILRSPEGTSRAWVAGYGNLNATNSFTVVTCTGAGKTLDCDHYWVVTALGPTFDWTALPDASAGVGGLGGIAGNGDVTGTVLEGDSAVPVVWKVRPNGRYGAPNRLGLYRQAGHFARDYFPTVISSAPGTDIEGGILATPAFYPDTAPALWGPKFEFDPGYIGSQTMAIGGTAAKTVVAVGCYEPVPVCAPACPIDPTVYTVSPGDDGVPVLSSKLVLSSPAAPHCGEAPFGITVDPQGKAFTVGQDALVARHDSKRLIGEAVVWEGETIKSLNALASRPGRTNLQSATAVNDLGWIAGVGEVAGAQDSAFVAVPTSGW